MKTIKINELNESCIRKDAQIIELSNFLEIEAEKIKNDLNIEIEEYSSDLINNNKYDINIKEIEVKIRKLKLKNEQYSSVCQSVHLPRMPLTNTEPWNKS